MTDVRFFTGSGHSEAIARACAGAMGEAALPMGEPLRENAVLLLVFPVYCERVPPPVAAFFTDMRGGAGGVCRLLRRHELWARSV